MRITRNAAMRLARSTTALTMGVIAILGAGPATATPASPSLYQRPAGYEQTQPGTILASRPVDVPALRSVSVRTHAWQLQYRTTAADGSPYVSVTTVVVPDGPARPRPLLSVQMAYDSSDPACAPSRTLAEGRSAPGRSSVAALELAIATTGLERGWAVVLPDPGGVDGRFFTPRVMGYATLDSVRAATHFAPSGLTSPTVKTALWGYSGGGIASSWAAELQPTYAPELRMAGAAIGAPVADLVGALYAANGRATSGLIPIGMTAIAKDDPAFATALNKYLTPAGRALIAQTGRECVNTTVLKNVFQPINKYLNRPISQVVADPTIARAMAIRGRGWRAPTMPVYVYNGVHDEVSVIDGTDRMVNSYCSKGASVTYIRDAAPDLVSTHGIVAMTGLGAGFDWISRALTTPAPVQQSGCSTRNVLTTPIDAANRALLPSYLGNLLKIQFGG